eukprot:jgi/Psemu1/2457/gm1.2457_g
MAKRTSSNYPVDVFPLITDGIDNKLRKSKALFVHPQHHRPTAPQTHSTTTMMMSKEEKTEEAPPAFAMSPPPTALNVGSVADLERRLAEMGSATKNEMKAPPPAAAAAPAPLVAKPAAAAAAAAPAVKGGKNAFIRTDATLTPVAAKNDRFVDGMRLVSARLVSEMK